MKPTIYLFSTLLIPYRIKAEVSGDYRVTGAWSLSQETYPRHAAGYGPELEIEPRPQRCKVTVLITTPISAYMCKIVVVQVFLIKCSVSVTKYDLY